MTDPTPYQLWQRTVDQGPGNPAWSAYDTDLQRMAGEINAHLQATPDYRALDWMFVKAMIWTESGAAHREWTRKPMQIGVTGDPGLAALLSAREGGRLILPPAWAGLTTETVRRDPQHNLHAGIGYLMMRAAYFEWRDVVTPPNAPITEVEVRPGDNYAKIAERNGSTTAHVTSINTTPAARLRPGQRVRVQPAASRQFITGWRVIDAQMVAARYNGGGDPRYADKINYCLGLIRRAR